MTIFGLQTVAELKDLLRNTDAEIKQLDIQWMQYKPSWCQADKNSCEQWESEYATMVKRYNKARRSAMTYITAATGVRDDLKPADSQYLAVLKSIKQAQTSTEGGASVSPGDLADLIERLTRAGADLHFDVVQPTAPDVDLAAYKAVDSMTKVIEKGGKKAGGLGVELGLGAAVGGIAGAMIVGPPAILTGAVVGAVAVGLYEVKKLKDWLST